MARECGQDRCYRFGELQLDAGRLMLERSGVLVPLTPEALQTLVALVEHAGTLVTKEALIARVWPDTNVVESSLTRNISVLRKTLEEDGGLKGAIETLPKRGYIFRAPVGVAYPGHSRPQPRALRYAALTAALFAVALAAWALRAFGIRTPAADSPAKRAALIALHHLDKQTAPDARRAL